MGGLEGTRREATTSLALDKSWGLTTDRRSRASASRGKEANPTNPGGVEGESGEFIKLTSVAKQNPYKSRSRKTPPLPSRGNPQKHANNDTGVGAAKPSFEGGVAARKRPRAARRRARC